MSNNAQTHRWFLAIALALCAIAQFSLGSDLLMRETQAMYQWGISANGNYAALAAFAGIWVVLIGLCAIVLIYWVLKSKGMARELSVAFGFSLLVAGVAFGLHASLGRMMELLFVIYVALGGLVLLGCYFMHLKKF